MSRPLHRLLQGPVSSLALALVALPLAAQAPTRLGVKAFQVARVQAEALALRAGLGLGEGDAFAPRASFFNGQGQTIVHLDQTYLGHRVLGSGMLARVQPDGSIRAQAQRPQAGIALPSAPRLKAESALAAAMRRLDPKGPLRGQPKVELVVFPARLVGGVATVEDPATHRPILDRKNVVHAQVAGDFTWAYEVKLRVQNPKDGHQERTYYVDGDTGEMLRIVNDLASASALSGVTPATASAQGYYRGPVTLSTTQMLDGTYSLWDMTRGTQPNPDLSYFSDDGSGWAPTGLQVWYNSHEADGTPTYSMYLYQANPTNTWGDGQPWSFAWGQENGTNGQSAGVDAMSAMATTWDFYFNVFGRKGMDGLDTGVYANVLATGGYMDGATDNAWWSQNAQSLTLGAGSYPANPRGFRSLTDLDIVAHEMTHGVAGSTSQLINDREEGGLSEGTSDFFAQMVKVYANRTPSDPIDAIPGAGADWQIGQNVGHGTPLRWMDLPSQDGRSVDAWYDGLSHLDGHFSAGVLTRALYLLAMGGSSAQGAVNHSPYHPAGFTGIGLDATARIWFKAVTENLYSGWSGSITFVEARDAAVAAAEDLYGIGSGPVESVRQAFSAVNVGLATGQAPRIGVAFAPWRDGDWVMGDKYDPDYWSKVEYLPLGEKVRPRISVTNTTDTRVTWRLGGPSVFGYTGSETGPEVGGVINADGSWTTPFNRGWHAITGSSVADPTQFAEGRAFLVNLDTDQDLENDALDMGGIAFSWYLSNGLNFSHSMFNAPWVDDADVAAYIDAVKNTWLPK